jgi:hypothetical protein
MVRVKIRGYWYVKIYLQVPKRIWQKIEKNFYITLERKWEILNTTYERIFESQYEFKKGVSLHYQHLDIQKLIFDALNDDKVLAIDLIFVNFEKAFDRIPISLLMQKMVKYNIDVNLLPICSSKICWVKEFNT